MVGQCRIAMEQICLPGKKTTPTFVVKFDVEEFGQIGKFTRAIGRIKTLRCDGKPGCFITDQAAEVYNIYQD